MTNKKLIGSHVTNLLLKLRCDGFNWQWLWYNIAFKISNPILRKGLWRLGSIAR